MVLRQIYEEGLSQMSYFLGCPSTEEALVVDPKRDVDTYLELAESLGLRIVAVAETHIHVANLHRLPKDKPILVHCLSGDLSSTAISALLARRFRNVYNLTGGIKAWMERGFPVEKGPEVAA